MKKVNTINQQKSSKNESRGMRRRDFFKLVGGGIFVFFLPRCATDSSIGPVSVERKLPKDFNAFLQIGEDGTVTCFTGKIEMGQGIITSLAQMMADELNVPFEKVKMVLGDTDLCPWDGGTWGSLTTREFGPSMRVAAAEAKGVLLELASAKLGVPVTQLEVKDGVIINTNDNTKTVSYSQLTKGKRIEKKLDFEPTVEDYSKFTYVGKSYLRQDSLLKVTGEAKYTGDIKIPGMVFARILRPPSHGAKLTTVDYTEAEKISGTTVVREGDFIAVLNENRNKADEAVVKIKAEYDFNEMPVNDKSIFEWMLKADSSANVEVSTGDLEEGRKLSEKIYESEFQDPYLAHAPMETHTALGQLVGDKLTVWAATQTPYPLRDDKVSV